jgi:hypothetical protein
VGKYLCTIDLPSREVAASSIRSTFPTQCPALFPALFSRYSRVIFALFLRYFASSYAFIRASGRFPPLSPPSVRCAICTLTLTMRRPPRVTLVMALVISCQFLIQPGEARDYADRTGSKLAIRAMTTRGLLL